MKRQKSPKGGALIGTLNRGGLPFISKGGGEVLTAAIRRWMWGYGLNKYTDEFVVVGGKERGMGRGGRLGTEKERDTTEPSPCGCKTRDRGVTLAVKTAQPRAIEGENSEGHGRPPWECIIRVLDEISNERGPRQAKHGVPDCGVRSLRHRSATWDGGRIVPRVEIFALDVDEDLKRLTSAGREAEFKVGVKGL